jgi:inner membrane protein
MRIDEKSGALRITDLRMGQEPAYVFSFLVARRGSELTEITPRAVGGRGDTPIAEALTWLWKRAGGADIEPPRR